MTGTKHTDQRGDWGGLTVSATGNMVEGEKGGSAVVLLHGWGAPGDDLVPLAEALAQPQTRFFMPAGPLVERGGGRAWWHLDPADRPAHAWDDQLKLPHRPHPQVTAARAGIQGVLRTIAERYQPDRIMIAGFSQGSMLALDVALCAAAGGATATTTTDPATVAPTPVDRVAVLSGVLLEDSLPFLLAPGARGLPVLVAHGRYDQVVPFTGGQAIAEILQRHRHTVTWRPFNGGHEIPGAVVADLHTFLSGA